VSRIPRFQEHLKTGFTAEAASAARFRAYAARAERDGMPNLARQWLRLAAEKDELAARLLDAAEQVRGTDTDLASAISEERYENDVLYPKMMRDVDARIADVFLKVVAAQKEHLGSLEDLRRAANASQGDVQLPAEVDQGVHGSQAAENRR
jgi:rubrerythrin